MQHADSVLSRLALSDFMTCSCGERCMGPHWDMLCISDIARASDLCTVQSGGAPPLVPPATVPCYSTESVRSLSRKARKLVGHVHVICELRYLHILFATAQAAGCRALLVACCLVYYWGGCRVYQMPPRGRRNEIGLGQNKQPHSG